MSDCKTRIKNKQASDLKARVKIKHTGHRIKKLKIKLNFYSLIKKSTERIIWLVLHWNIILTILIY